MDLLFKKISNLSDQKYILYASFFAISLDTIYYLYLNIIFSLFEYLNLLSPHYLEFFIGPEDTASDLEWFIGAVLFAPVIETLLLHSLLYFIISKFTKDRLNLIVLITVLFSVIHIPNGYIALFGTLSSSFILATTYVVFREESFKKAFIYTSLIHAIGNFYVSIMVLLFDS